MIRFKITPTSAARPMPPIVMLPMLISAPPMPVVRIKEAMTRLRVLPRSTLFFIRVLTPTDAMVPKSRSMMPPRTASGIVLRRALTLPKIEKRMPNTAAMRITAGSAIFVSDTAPVTSEYVVTGGPPRIAEATHASPSPNMVRCRPGSFTKSFPVTSLIA